MKYVVETLEYPNRYSGDYPDRVYVYFCPTCGTELTATADSPRDNSSNLKELEWEVNNLKGSTSERVINDYKKKKKKLEYLKKAVQLEKEYLAKYQAFNKKYENFNTCPICGATLRKTPGYYIPNCSSTNYWLKKSGNIRFFEADGEAKHDSYPAYADGRLKSMALVRDTIETQNAAMKANAFIHQNDCPVLSSSVSAEQIQQAPDKLKAYLQALLQLENNIYSLSRQLSMLYHRKLNVDRSIALETHQPAFQARAKADQAIAAYKEAVEKLKAVQSRKPGLSVNKIIYPTEPEAPVLGTPGFFNKKKVLAENERLLQNYQLEMAKYKSKVEQCDAKKAQLLETERIEIENEINAAQNEVNTAMSEQDQAKATVKKLSKQASSKLVPSSAASQLLSQEITQTEALLKKTLQTRNELYGTNVVFIKYRNPVALASFSEYLMSGRCVTLEGANGAYNIYENEIRMNHVIDQLDTVIASLEDIKQNQFMMYSEMKSIHNSLDHLNNTMSKALDSVQRIEVHAASMEEHMQHISQNSDVIAHHTALGAYYAKMNAELTNALGYMAALR